MNEETEYRREPRNVPLTNLLHPDQALHFYFNGQEVGSLLGVDGETQLSGHAFCYYRDRLPDLREGRTVLFPTNGDPSMPSHMGTVREVFADDDALVLLTDEGRAVVYFEGIDLQPVLASGPYEGANEDFRFPRVLK